MEEGKGEERIENVNTKEGEVKEKMNLRGKGMSISINRGRVAALLSTPIPYFLGEISYSLYLVTDPFRWPAVAIVKALHPAPVPPHMAMALAAMFTLLMIAPSWVTYSLVERPGRQALRSLLSRRASRQPLAAPPAGP